MLIDYQFAYCEPFSEGLAGVIVSEDTSFNPLTKAIFENDMDAIKELVGAGANLDEREEMRTAPITVACALGHADIVKYLIDNGASVDTNDNWTGSAIQLSITYGHPDCLRELLDHGVNVNVIGMGGVSPLQNALMAGRLDMIEMMIDARRDELTTEVVKEAIVTAVGIESSKGLALLLTPMPRVELGWRTAWGAELLVLATERCNDEAVHMLLEQGVPADAWTAGREVSALHVAAAKGNTDIVRLFLDGGADINASLAGGWTPLGLAEVNEQRDVVELLRLRGAKSVTPTTEPLSFPLFYSTFSTQVGLRGPEQELRYPLSW